MSPLRDTSLRWFIAGAVLLATAGCELAHRSSPHHVLVVDVSPDGKYVGSLDQAGRIRVWDLESRSEVISLRRPPKMGGPATGYSAMALRGATGAVLFECRDGEICSGDLRSGLVVTLAKFDDHQDRLVLLASSANGRRIAMATLLGSVLSYATDSKQLRIRKPRDIWSIDPLRIHMLEGTPDLESFASATELAAVPWKGRSVRQPSENRSEGYLDFGDTKGPMWRELVIWPFDSGIERIPTYRPNFRVRGAFRPDGGEFAVCDEGGPWIVLSLVNNTESTDISLDRNSLTSCYGIRYLDAAGKYLGVTADGENRIWLSERVGTGNEWKDAGTRFLRHIPGNGARPMTSLPERNWVFIGLMSGGVDWYEFDPDGWPSFSLIAHLSNEAE